MHISEGVLSTPVLIGGATICAGFTAIGLKRIENKDIPKAALLTAAFFIASLIHIPLGPSNVHLMLNGLIGVMLGLTAFPALLVGLFFQAILFQFGGLTVLGINTVNMALPGILVYYLCKPFIKSKRKSLIMIGGFMAGSGSVLGSGILVALTLYLSNKGFLSAAKVIILVHIPVMIIEGVITSIVISFIKKIRPEILTGLIIIIFIPTFGFCHRINIFCYVDGQNINCEAKFHPGGPVRNGKIIVASVQTGKVILQTKTDEKGKVSFKIPAQALKKHWDLKVTCEAEMGHKNFWIINSNEMIPEQVTDLSKGSVYEEKGGKEMLISKEEIELIISQVLRKELAPVKRDIAELKESKISFQDIIGGLGYIFGIAGIIMYFMGKRSLRK